MHSVESNPRKLDCTLVSMKYTYQSTVYWVLDYKWLARVNL